MILTELYDGQGLGNQLWVYAACRSIAEKLQMPHKILSPDKFKGNSFLDIDFGLKFFMMKNWPNFPHTLTVPY